MASGVPTSTIDSTGFSGTHVDIDDGTAFGDVNASDFMQQSASGTADFRVAFSLSAGTLNEVVVNFRGGRAGSPGTGAFIVRIYDGTTLIATDTSQLLSIGTNNYTRTFSGITVAAANLRVDFEATTSGSEVATVYMLWVDATYAGVGTAFQENAFQQTPQAFQIAAAAAARPTPLIVSTAVGRSYSY